MEKKKPIRFYVEYNGKVMGVYKYITGALNLVKRKGWQNDYDNALYLYDNNGDMYSPYSGQKRKGSYL